MLIAARQVALEYQESGKTCLLYSVAGESGIAIAALTPQASVAVPT